ncbi:hypothetical protein E2C01_097449 [Portunus trituberculatus]|uniref:Uncharacterized protein n=1 Tax=Portunus trituberculatus TaxID=210409 RepID=A0A5B7JYI6_PORTR|nr:hypothetical protein [Portunus trituberculatus]
MPLIHLTASQCPGSFYRLSKYRQQRSLEVSSTTALKGHKDSLHSSVLFLLLAARLLDTL